MPIDVGEADFRERVLEASRTTPVVVDFWAGWCQPCRVLGPVLERVESDLAGRVVLAKVDVDASPNLAATFGIRGIPAVKAFRDGGVVSEFVGVQPEAAVRAFFEALAPDRRTVDAARAALDAGDIDAAERGFRDRLAERPDDGEAAAGLAEVLLARDDLEGATRAISGLPRTGSVARAGVAVDLRRWAAGEGDLATAASDALAGDPRSALERCLKLVASGTDADGARELAIAIFTLRGDDDPFTRDYRRRLTALLY